MSCHANIFGSTNTTIGSCNDFAFQLSSKFGLSRDEFTIVAFDLPGYGKSEPKAEEKAFDPTLQYFEFCALVGAKLMSSLGHKTYSIAGWDDGARVASLIAVTNQSRVNALILWGFIPVMDKETAGAIARTRDTGSWNEQIREYYSSVYGEQLFSDLWRKYVDFIIASLELPDQFDIRQRLAQIKCPTLIMYGSEDPIVSYTEHVKPLEMLIYDSELLTFKGLAHNIHQANPGQFNQVVTSFVTSVRA